MGSGYSNLVHFDEHDKLVVETSGVIKTPVFGTTAYNASDVLTGTTLPNYGNVFLTQDSSSDPRLFSVKAPVPGCELCIIIGTSQTTGNQRQINLGSGVGVKYAGTTSMQYISVSTDSVSTFTYKAITLVGLSTSLWAVKSAMPSTTAFTFAAATS
ncbi:MAG: hypothetical protein WC455_14085 [Dehalococcoidia bacterium]|jgi:hypothetical protein